MNSNLRDKILGEITSAKAEGKLARGALETIRSVQKRRSKLVVMAENIDLPEVVFEVKRLCNRNDIPLVSSFSRKELGEHAGVDNGASFVSVEVCGFDKASFENLIFAAKAKSR